jgi:hypothetical protein
MSFSSLQIIEPARTFHRTYLTSYIRTKRAKLPEMRKLLPVLVRQVDKNAIQALYAWRCSIAANRLFRPWISQAVDHG